MLPLHTDGSEGLGSVALAMSRGKQFTTWAGTTICFSVIIYSQAWQLPFGREPFEYRSVRKRCTGLASIIKFSSANLSAETKGENAGSP